MIVSVLTLAANAQPYGPGGMMGPGMMMGPGIAGPGAFGRMCGPGATGFSEWRINRLEQVLKLTDAQRPKFEEFKAASVKAAEGMRPTLDAFYAVLTDEQKELIDSNSGSRRFWRWRDRW
jgi:hypothetical protein